MPTIKEVIKSLKSHKDQNAVCAWDMWLVQDVQDRARDFHDKEISKEDAEKVLEIMTERHDANTGLNWDFMDFCMEDAI